MTTAQAQTATDRAYNFSAGPAVLPEPVVKQAQKDLWNVFGSGMGVCELSHRGPEYDRILEEALADTREIGKIPDNYHILFMQGGATLQTSMIPMSFLPAGKTADYFDTGKWAHDAAAEASKFGSMNVAGITRDDNYNHLPTEAESKYTAGAAYCFFVSNNTIYGTQYNRFPNTTAPLVCDMSSDIYCRPIEWNKYAMVYASLQKNLGPSGQACVIIRDDFLQTAPEGTLPKLMDYKIAQKKESRYNTPNTFAVYLMGQVVKWIKSEFGSLEEVEKYNVEKAALLYDMLDNSPFYSAHVNNLDERSTMNIPFKTTSEALDKQFIAEAAKVNLSTLAGHRSIGGMRASMYNAMPIEGARALVDFMKKFEQQNA